MINKFQDFVNEHMSNLSKNRKWKINSSGKHEFTDLYFTYKLPKSELGEYLNTWFEGVVAKSKDGSITYRDEMVTLKKVDKDTANRLYHKFYNPITINIMYLKPNKNDKGEDLYTMKAQIHSVDDSSFGIWWDDKTFEELSKIRIDLMKWINANPIINGEEFLNVCVNLSATEDSKDYD
jgi:hypothetical protein